MFDFAEKTENMSAIEILNYYRNLYYAEPQVTERGIVANTINDVFNLINRQKAEIERLQKEVNLVSIQFQDVQERAEEYRLKIENLQNVISNQQIEISAKIEKQIKAEAYKEFAERLKRSTVTAVIGNKIYAVATSKGVDNILKEMVGEDK